MVYTVGDSERYYGNSSYAFAYFSEILRRWIYRCLYQYLLKLNTYTGFVLLDIFGGYQVQLDGI